MPLYEYQCTVCHKRTEKIQKFSDPEITACPKCGGVLERVISAPAISFKGGGWFADGYGNAKPAGSGSGETGSSGDTAKSDSKSESKPTSDRATPAATTPTAAPAATSTPAASAPASKS